MFGALHASPVSRTLSPSLAVANVALQFVLVFGYSPDHYGLHQVDVLEGDLRDVQGADDVRPPLVVLDTLHRPSLQRAQPKMFGINKNFNI